MRVVLAMLASLTLAGCSRIHHEQLVPLQGCPAKTTPQKLVVFFDGTANTEASHTNVMKLHSMVSLQNRCDINTFYVEGVGTAGKFLGAGTGWGMRDRVAMAYRWLGENYRADRHDSLFVFGFSRGAYAARIFASFTNAAGVPDLRYVPPLFRDVFTHDVYDAYKGDMSMEQRKRLAKRAMQDVPAAPVDVAFMGLFETVEAMGVARPLKSRLFHWQEENVEIPNWNYGDQLCNVKRAAHAMSLDDDRAFIFTPILLTRGHLTRECGDSVNIDAVVNEVWFSGAHSDVGGRTGTELDDVPLNWMIGELRGYDIIRGDTVYSDTFGEVENPRSGWAKVAYGFYHRNLPYYIQETTYNHGRLKVHDSALRRLENRPVEFWQNSWHKSEPFNKCFSPRAQAGANGVDTVYVFHAGPECPVDRVYSAPPRPR